jgi:hypothetical protein
MSTTATPAACQVERHVTSQAELSGHVAAYGEHSQGAAAPPRGKAPP